MLEVEDLVSEIVMNMMHREKVEGHVGKMNVSRFLSACALMSDLMKQRLNGWKETDQNSLLTCIPTIYFHDHFSASHYFITFIFG